MSGLRFVPVTAPGQIQAVAALAERIWKEHYSSILKPEQIDYMVEKFQSAPAISDQLAHQNYRYYLLNADGADVGYAAVHPGEDALFLSTLYLSREVRGGGYASRTLPFLESLCRQRKLPKIWLTVNRFNSGSIAAYQKLGFETVRTQVADIGHGYVMDDYIMEKPVL